MHDSPISIRLAKVDDVPAIAVLIPLSVRSLQAADYTPAQMEGALGTVFGVDRTLIEDKTYFVAVRGDIIVGCGGWSRRRTLFGADELADRDDQMLDPTVDSARIRAFFVHPEHARQGIGNRLVEACEQAAVAAGFQSLELVGTLAGERLYARHGYHAVERYTVSLTNGESLPVVRMRKGLL